jgi:hypothetical protein
MQALRIPDEVTNEPDAREILRVWVTGDVQRFALRGDAWSDPAAWGLLFVDLARHVARAHCELHGGAPEVVLARLREGFDAEWATPTDTSPGTGSLR